MSTATELLRRALEAYDHKEEPYFERLHHAFEEIRTYLSTHSDDADEPVAWFEYAEHADAWFLSYRYNPNAKTKPLYLHPPRPETARKPLNGEEILRAFEATGFTNTDYRLRCFIEGVRFAENHHWISSSIPSLNDTISANSRDSRL